MEEKKRNKGYEDLEIYQVSFELALKVHKLSFQLPNYELYETGSQVRRSSKSIPANIVEGFGRSKYKSDYIKFLTYALASCHETVSHLALISNLYDTIAEIKNMISEYNSLGRKIRRFSQHIETNYVKIK